MSPAAVVDAVLRRPAVEAVVLALALAARAAVVLGLSALAWAALPTAFGGVATTVMSGSMSPRIQPGDVVVSLPMPRPEWHLGRVLLVTDPDRPDRMRLHRLHGVDARGMLVMKGDANRAPDTSPVHPSALRGVAVLRVPLIGLPVLWVRTGRWAELAAVGAVLAVLLALIALDRRADPAEEDPDEQEGERGPGSAVPVLLAGALVAALVGAAPEPGLAWAAWSTTTANPGNTFVTRPCFALAPADRPSFSYSFSEASGTSVTDDTGNGRTGALRGGAARSGTCASGDVSLALTGTSGAFAVYPTSVTTTSDLTMELWFRTSTTGAVLADLGNASTGNSTASDRVLSLDSSGSIHANLGGDYFAQTGGNRGLANGAWHLVDLVTSGSTVSLYLDGAVAWSYAIQVPPTATGYWRFGGDSSKYLNGSLDDLAVYPAALTAAQIANHWSRGR